jgi:beta-lactamase class A
MLLWERGVSEGPSDQARRQRDGIDADIRRRVESAVSDFVNQEPPRAVALESLRGPLISVSVNGGLQLPAASLVKLPLATALYEQAAVGTLALDEHVLHRDLGRTAYPSVLQVFSDDHMFTLKELCGLMLATSDNPISQYLLDRVGINLVNREARRLGASSTRIVVGFLDELLGDRGRGNVTTADDALIILTALATNPAYESLIIALRNNLRNFRMPLRLPDTLPIAHKTGSLTGVAVDAGVAYGRNVDLAVAFLSDHQSDTARTSLSIGDCMGQIWDSLGEEVELPGGSL